MSEGVGRFRGSLRKWGISEGGFGGTERRVFSSFWKIDSARDP